MHIEHTDKTLTVLKWLLLRHVSDTGDRGPLAWDDYIASEYQKLFGELTNAHLGALGSESLRKVSAKSTLLNKKGKAGSAVEPSEPEAV